MKVNNCVVELRSRKLLEFSTACIAEPNFDFVETATLTNSFHLSTFHLSYYQIIQFYLGYIVYSFSAVVGVAFLSRNLGEAYLLGSLAYGDEE